MAVVIRLMFKDFAWQIEWQPASAEEKMYLISMTLRFITGQHAFKLWTQLVKTIMDSIV